MGTPCEMCPLLTLQPLRCAPLSADLTVMYWEGEGGGAGRGKVDYTLFLSNSYVSNTRLKLGKKIMQNTKQPSQAEKREKSKHGYFVVVLG